MKTVEPDKIILCDVGEIWIYKGNKYYIGGNTSQGYVFKDSKIYDNAPDEICYIAEADILDHEKLAFEKGKIKAIDYNDVSNALCGYTHNDILNICEGNERIAREVFETCDWQHISSYYDEFMMYTDEMTDEEKEYYGIN